MSQLIEDNFYSLRETEQMKTEIKRTNNKNFGIKFTVTRKPSKQEMEQAIPDLILAALLTIFVYLWVLG